jgi:hypothetical protein
MILNMFYSEAQMQTYKKKFGAKKKPLNGYNGISDI